MGYSPFTFFSLQKIIKYNTIQKNIIRKYNSEKRMPEHSKNGYKLVEDVQKYKN